MIRRRSITYIEPASLADLRRIVQDCAKLPDQTRVWLRHGGDTAPPYIEIGTGCED